MHTTPAVSIVVPTFQRERTVGATIRAILDQELPDTFELIVVDNGSTDGTAELLALLAAADERLRILRIDSNRGPGPARNAGWQAASARLVCFTDDDCIPQTGWLAGLLEAAEGADVVMGATIPDPVAMEDSGPFSHWVRVENPMPWFPTCNILYRRSLLEELGGFDESFTADFGSSFGDDTDLGWRALERQAVVWFQPASVVHHEVTPSSWRSWQKAARRRRGVPAVVARHPGLRSRLPRPWLYQYSHGHALRLLVGALGIVVRPRSPLAWAVGAVLGSRYVVFRMLGLGNGRPAKQSGLAAPLTVLGFLVTDVTEMVIVARQAARERILLL